MASIRRFFLNYWETVRCAGHGGGRGEIREGLLLPRNAASLQVVRLYGVVVVVVFPRPGFRAVGRGGVKSGEDAPCCLLRMPSEAWRARQQLKRNCRVLDTTCLSWRGHGCCSFGTKRGCCSNGAAFAVVTVPQEEFG